MERTKNEEIVLATIKAVEERDFEALEHLYHPQIEFNWPPGLPYSGRFNAAEVPDMTMRFAAVWEPLQPTDVEKRMDPIVVASAGDTVVVEYIWRAVDTTGRRFETSTLARYEVRDERLARARMYYFDLPGMLAFLDGTGVELPRDASLDRS